ncbi:MAG: hypothetical protein EBZ95_04850 [Chitinophagia bacterium]|nr:hypothetical protein [Chitinophagia bacterium]
MKIRIPEKLRTEDFPTDIQDSIGKIGKIYNQFTDSVFRALNGNVDFDNLARQLVTIDITTDSSGKLVNPPQVKITNLIKVNGLNCINAINLVNPAIYPSTSPFVSFSINGQILSILNVSGIQVNSQYRLTLELL